MYRDLIKITLFKLIRGHLMNIINYAISHYRVIITVLVFTVVRLMQLIHAYKLNAIKFFILLEILLWSYNIFNIL